MPKWIAGIAWIGSALSGTFAAQFIPLAVDSSDDLAAPEAESCVSRQTELKRQIVETKQANRVRLYETEWASRQTAGQLDSKPELIGSNEEEEFKAAIKNAVRGLSLSNPTGDAILLGLTCDELPCLAGVFVEPNHSKHALPQSLPGLLVDAGYSIDEALESTHEIEFHGHAGNLIVIGYVPGMLLEATPELERLQRRTVQRIDLFSEVLAKDVAS